MVLHRSMLDWRRGFRVSLPWVYVHPPICETCCVSWCCRDLCSIGGGGAVCLHW